MHKKKLTLSMDEEIYEGLRKIVGPRKIAKFIESLVRPYIVRPTLEAAYAHMANDRKRSLPGNRQRSLSSGAPPVKRGEIWWVDFDRSPSSEIKGKHRAVVVSNDASNRFLSRVQVIPLTPKAQSDRLYPCEALVVFNGHKAKVMTDQLAIVGKSQLLDRAGTLSEDHMLKIKEAIQVQFDFY